MSHPSLAILMYTYNGEKFLPQQLASFDAQTFKNWSLFVYDDCSTDSTQAIIKKYIKNQTKNKRIELLSRKTNLGIIRNFLDSIHSMPNCFNFYAFSDQDDVWLPNKLERAVHVISQAASDTPAMYCSNSELIDASGQRTGERPIFKTPPSFKHALVENIAFGHTIVFNRAALSLILKVDWRDISSLSPDFFMYQLLAGAGGKVYYDTESHVLYRQHETNWVGYRPGLLDRCLNLCSILSGVGKKVNDRYFNALQKNSALLTKQNQSILHDFMAARAGSFLDRLVYFINSDLYKSTKFGTVRLFIRWMLNAV